MKYFYRFLYKLTKGLSSFHYELFQKFNWLSFTFQKKSGYGRHLPAPMTIKQRWAGFKEELSYMMDYE